MLLVFIIISILTFPEAQSTSTHPNASNVTSATVTSIDNNRTLNVTMFNTTLNVTTSTPPPSNSSSFSTNASSNISSNTTYPPSSLSTFVPHATNGGSDANHSSTTLLSTTSTPAVSQPITILSSTQEQPSSTVATTAFEPTTTKHFTSATNQQASSVLSTSSLTTPETTSFASLQPNVTSLHQTNTVVPTTLSPNHRGDEGGNVPLVFNFSNSSDDGKSPTVLLLETIFTAKTSSSILPRTVEIAKVASIGALLILTNFVQAGFVGFRSNFIIIVARSSVTSISNITEKPSNPLQHPFSFFKLPDIAYDSPFAFYSTSLVINFILLLVPFLLIQCISLNIIKISSRKQQRWVCQILGGSILLVVMSYFFGGNAQISTLLLSIGDQSTASVERSFAAAVLVGEIIVCCFLGLMLTQAYGAVFDWKNHEFVNAHRSLHYIEKWGFLLNTLQYSSADIPVRLYFCIEAALSIVFGALSGMVDTCNTYSFLFAILLAICSFFYEVYMIWYRPLQRSLYHGIVVSIGVLQFIMSIAAILAVKDSSNIIFLQIVAVCEILLTIVLCLFAFRLLCASLLHCVGKMGERKAKEEDDEQSAGRRLAVIPRRHQRREDDEEMNSDVSDRGHNRKRLETHRNEIAFLFERWNLHPPFSEEEDTYQQFNHLNVSSQSPMERIVEIDSPTGKKKNGKQERKKRQGNKKKEKQHNKRRGCSAAEDGADTPLNVQSTDTVGENYFDFLHRKKTKMEKAKEKEEQLQNRKKKRKSDNSSKTSPSSTSDDSSGHSTSSNDENEQLSPFEKLRKKSMKKFSNSSSKHAATNADTIWEDMHLPSPERMTAKRREKELGIFFPQEDRVAASNPLLTVPRKK